MCEPAGGVGWGFLSPPSRPAVRPSSLDPSLPPPSFRLPLPVTVGASVRDQGPHRHLERGKHASSTQINKISPHGAGGGGGGGGCCQAQARLWEAPAGRAGVEPPLWLIRSLGGAWGSGKWVAALRRQDQTQAGKGLHRGRMTASLRISGQAQTLLPARRCRRGPRRGNPDPPDTQLLVHSNKRAPALFIPSKQSRLVCRRGPSPTHRVSLT